MRLIPLDQCDSYLANLINQVEEKERRLGEMAEADRHQEELMELEKKKAEDMEAARDKDIKQFYADYKVWRIFSEY